MNRSFLFGSFRTQILCLIPSTLLYAHRWSKLVMCPPCWLTLNFKHFFDFAYQKKKKKFPSPPPLKFPLVPIIGRGSWHCHGHATIATNLTNTTTTTTTLTNTFWSGSLVSSGSVMELVTHHIYKNMNTDLILVWVVWEWDKIGGDGNLISVNLNKTRWWWCSLVYLGKEVEFAMIGFRSMWI